MFISHKSNVIQQINDVEWDCRRKTKGLTKPEYWTWLASVTSGDPPVVDLSGETGYVIVECTDENVQARLNQLSDYQAEGVYNIKYYASKRDAEEIKDIDGNSHDPKQYVQSHFIGQDDTRDARILAEKLANLRKRRNNLLTESDWWASSDLVMSDDRKAYRQALRDLPSGLDTEEKVNGATFPTKPG